jgi:signal peptidase
MALRSLDEINREFMLEVLNKTTPPVKRPLRKKRGILSVSSNILFFLAIFVILIAIFTSGSGDGAPKEFLGYYYHVAKTSSIENEVQSGALILAYEPNPQTLKVGDNITFIRGGAAAVTYKIVKIEENYDNNGARRFTTKGISNYPDIEIIYEPDIVGKAILVIPVAGAFISALDEDIFLVFIISGLLLLLSFFLRFLFYKTRRN